jgi:hypothetical protein
MVSVPPISVGGSNDSGSLPGMPKAGRAAHPLDMQRLVLRFLSYIFFALFIASFFLSEAAFAGFRVRKMATVDLHKPRRGKSLKLKNSRRVWQVRGV